MTTTKVVTAESVEFFKANAGVGYNPAYETFEQGRHRGAVNLAEAEAWLSRKVEAEDARVEWSEDPDYFGDARGDVPENEWLASVEQFGHLFCVLYVKRDCGHFEVAASLGSIVGDENYRRVIEAELAEEARER